MTSGRGNGALLCPAEREALERPTGAALGLPGRAYVDPQFYEAERRTVFRRTWVAAAVASDVPEAGDVLPVDVAGWPLVVVRGRAGALRAFHNVCRHRGAAVVTAPGAAQPVLRCPWHGWCYELDGSLKGTPELGGVGEHGSPELDPAQHGLVEVRTAQWFDVLFVNLDGQAPPIETYLSALLRRFPKLDFDALRRTHTWSTRYPCNWKLAVESGIEDYHLPFLHPGLTQGAFRGERSVVESDGEVLFLCGEVSESQWGQGRGRSDLPRLPALAGLEGDDARTLFFLHLFPSAVLGISPDCLYVGVWLPDGVAGTRLTFHHYFAGDGATAPDLAPTRAHVVDTIREVFSQDVPVVAAVQRGAAGRDEIGVRQRFSPFWETAVHGFQKTVARHLAAQAPG